MLSLEQKDFLYRMKQMKRLRDMAAELRQSNVKSTVKPTKKMDDLKKARAKKSTKKENKPFRKPIF